MECVGGGMGSGGLNGGEGWVIEMKVLYGG